MVLDIFNRQKLLFFFSLFFAQVSFCQKHKSDTIFLKRGDSTNGYYRVFILNGYSDYHNNLFINIKENTARYAEINKLLEDSLKYKKKIVPHSLATGEWISLHSYKGKLYAYSPSEPYVNLYLNVTNNTIDINDFNDGIIPFQIVGIDKTKKNRIVYNVIGLYEYARQISFYFLNKQKDIAIVEFTNQAKEKKYEVVATKNKVLHMPIIINDNPSSRFEEWQFDNIDYSQIFNRKVNRSKVDWYFIK